MQNHPFKLILFDFDGTLVDSQAMIADTMSKAFTLNGLSPPDPVSVRRVIGLHLAEAIDILLEDQGRRDLVAEVVEEYKRAFFIVRSNPGFLEPMFPGVRDVLEDLMDPGAQLGIATGKGREGLVSSLQRHGLERYFTVLKTADDGPGKPHPAILLQALEETAVVAEEAVLIGDTKYDMAMAKAAGIRAIGASWGYHESAELETAGADILLNDIREMPAALQRLGED